MFWLGAILPVLNWLSFSLYAHIPARAMTGTWFLVFLAASFGLGLFLELRQLFRGLAIGLSISSMIAVGQWFGWIDLPSYKIPAGLLYNSAVQAIAIALVISALICTKDWKYIPVMLPGLVIAQSRGGYLVLLLGLAGNFFGWRSVVLLLSIAAALSLTFMGTSDIDRLLIWHVAWDQLDWFGHGPGSFSNLLFQWNDGVHYPGHVHNDYLQLAYELGLLAIPFYLIYAAALIRTRSLYWPAFAGFAASSVFFFPLYAPVTAFIGAVMAGQITRGK